MLRNTFTLTRAVLSSPQVLSFTSDGITVCTIFEDKRTAFCKLAATNDDDAPE